MISVFLPAVEATIVATAMPTIVADLGGFSLFSWVFGAYLLMQAVSTPIYGRFADLYGRKKVFFVGAGIFLVSSAACGFAWGMIPLVVFRTLQGMGAGALQSIPFTIIGDIYGPEERARKLGWLSSVWGVAAVTGPMLGGFIVQYLHWALVFWINLPIGVATIAMLAYFHDERLQSRQHEVDYLGAILLMLGVGAPMIVLVQAQSLGAWTIVCLLAGGGVALVALFIQERRVREPIVPFKLWRNRVIAIGNFGSLSLGAIMMGVSAFLPTYVQGVMGRSPTLGGFAVAAQSISWSLAGIGAGALMVRTSYRFTGAAGALALIAGTSLLIALDPARGVVWAICGAFTIGVGLGLCNTTLVVAVQASVGWGERGVATSSNLFLRNIGQTLGAALGGAILNFGISRHAPEGVGAVNRLFEPSMRESLGAAGIARLSQAIASSLHEVYLIGGLLAVATLALMLRLPPGLSPTRAAEEDPRRRTDAETQETARQAPTWVE